MNTTSEARERILSRIRAANAERVVMNHPGPFEGWRPEVAVERTVDAFARHFESVGGEVVRVPDSVSVVPWLTNFAVDFTGAAFGNGVPAAVRAVLPEAPPESAGLAISAARAAIAETGSLVMDARDGRRTQLLCPTHVVILSASDVMAGAREAFAELGADLPSAIGLHSGPSKSADIGQVMVKGVHGPARVIALIIEEGALP